MRLDRASVIVSLSPSRRLPPLLLFVFSFSTSLDRAGGRYINVVPAIRMLLVDSYARIFFRISVATREIYPRDVTTAELREAESVLINHMTGKEYRLKAIGDAGPVIDAGGIIAYARKAGMIPSAAA
ncbi:3-isopropylmalate dehydratase small subunit 3-like [Raphanus sativus]|nr:3-isopropylmalate dehydratase small subunit 3-like [Raphanus sativus]